VSKGFTPGPWHLDYYFTGQMQIAKTARHSILGPHEPRKLESNDSAYAVDEANALLISAAPEMLKALRMGLDFLAQLKTQASVLPGECDDFEEHAKDAIAKAEGSTT
jgi:hypothetical protein